MSNRTYLDSGVIFAAYRGQHSMHEAARALLGDAAREFVLSAAVELEVLPKAIYYGGTEERHWYEGVLRSSMVLPWDLRWVRRARSFADKYGLAAMDAFHVAAALEADASELVTTEKPQKPLFRVTELRVRHIADFLPAK